MKRRALLLGGAALALNGCRDDYGSGLFNPCLGGLPAELLQHELVTAALAGIDAKQYWDGHVHLIGTGDSDSGIWVNPNMQRFWHVKQYLQFRFYLNASCSKGDDVDRDFLKRLLALHGELPTGARLVLLAFDYSYDEKGRLQKNSSAFHTPNDYAAKVAALHPGKLEWIASIHPYRHDCVEALEQAVSQGARAVKWLPPAMGMNPASSLCEPFYRAMKKHDIPLLVHAGEEKAVHGANTQHHGNPLLLRKPLDMGVRVIVAHCASLGRSRDLDNANREVDSFDLFSRMMQEKKYEGLLLGEVSAMTQVNRLGKPLDSILKNQQWHPRLINASDYPLPAVIPLFSLGKMVKQAYITREQAEVLGEVRKYNALLFDLLLKRMVRKDGLGLQDIVFNTRRVFEKQSTRVF